MKRQGGGHIIGVASGSSVRGYRSEVAYCTGKHAIEGFVKALTLEAAPYAIAVNTIGPGETIKPTRITRAELEAIPAEERAAGPIPWRWGRPSSGWRRSPPPLPAASASTPAPGRHPRRRGFDFAFAPEKATLYVDDFVTRQAWYANYSD